MTRAAVAVTVLCALLPRTAASQDAGDRMQVRDLAAPASPAFVLLDIAPNAVERPENPKPFVVSLLNRLTRSESFPKDYALEAVPYWFKSHPDLTFEQYQTPGPWQSVLQSFSVSVATAPLDAGTAAASSGTRLGLGLRTNVVNGRPNSKMAEVLTRLESIHNKILDGGTPTEEDRAAAKKAALEVQALDVQRVGWFVTAAGGQAWEASGDNFENVKATRRGFWVTPAYRAEVCRQGAGAAAQCTSTVDFIAVLRVLDAPAQDAIWDYGGRLIWRPKPQLYLSLEALGRRGNTTQESDDSSSRTVGFVEYRIRPEFSLYGGFGRDFEKESGVRPLVSTIGLNLGFGAPTLKTSSE